MRRSRPSHGGGGSRRENTAASYPSENAPSVPDGTQSVNRVREIDAILSESATADAASTPAVGAGTHLDRIHPLNPTFLGAGTASMTADEEARLISDVYGRKPPEAALMDDRLEALEREIGRLGREERSALERALRHHPLLTIVSPHVRDVLREENFDAPSAARRLARYWRQREAVFGSRAFSSGLLAQPVFDDYIRRYHMSERAMNDPELDGDIRNMAAEYVRIVGRVKIEAMDTLIERHPDGDAVREARELYPEVALSYEHNLLFLKAEQFVESYAAVRMMKYWAMKKTLFGPERLGRDITLSDLESSVFESNMIGHSLLAPGTDEGGRTIFWGSAMELAYREGWTAIGVAQYLWYVLHMALSRPSCRDKGLVAMINARGVQDLTRTNMNKMSEARQLCMSLTMSCMPFRTCVVHIFFSPSSWWQSFISVVSRAFTTFVKNRFVMHLGTCEENRKILNEQFGIGPGLMVKDVGGDIDLEWWRDLIRKRKQEE